MDRLARRRGGEGALARVRRQWTSRSIAAALAAQPGRISTRRADQPTFDEVLPGLAQRGEPLLLEIVVGECEFFFFFFFFLDCAHSIVAMVNKILNNIWTVCATPEDELRDAIVSGRLQPDERLIEIDLERRRSGRKDRRCGPRWCASSRRAWSSTSATAARGSGFDRQGTRPLRSFEARAVLEGAVGRHAAPERDPDDIPRPACGSSPEMSALTRQPATCSAPRPERGAARASFEIAGHDTANALDYSALKSQLVRFQYRTILLPAAAALVLRAHGGSRCDRRPATSDEAEAAMRTHLSHVADALRSAEA